MKLVNEVNVKNQFARTTNPKAAEVHANIGGIYTSLVKKELSKWKIMTDHNKQLEEIEKVFVKRLKIGSILLILIFIAGIAWVVVNEKITNYLYKHYFCVSLLKL